MRRVAVAGLLALALAGCGRTTEPPAVPQGADGWLEFEGSWIAAGSRRVVALGGERRASVVDLRGTVLLTGSSRPGVGFSAEVIGLNDTASGFVGRAAWTDEHGEQVFSELRGEVTATGNRITGTFIDGTGRYAGATGGYEFSWQYVLESEDGKLQGRAVGLKGRVRLGSGQASPSSQGGKP
jgi:hypothetical protein